MILRERKRWAEVDEGGTPRPVQTSLPEDGA
jgi:hypothetical protein